jgi:hypothetical protein
LPELLRSRMKGSHKNIKFCRVQKTIVWVEERYREVVKAISRMAYSNKKQTSFTTASNH